MLMPSPQICTPLPRLHFTSLIKQGKSKSDQRVEKEYGYLCICSNLASLPGQKYVYLEIHVYMPWLGFLHKINWTLAGNITLFVVQKVWSKVNTQIELVEEKNTQRRSKYLYSMEKGNFVVISFCLLKPQFTSYF